MPDIGHRVFETGIVSHNKAIAGCANYQSHILETDVASGTDSDLSCGFIGINFQILHGSNSQFSLSCT